MLNSREVRWDVRAHVTCIEISLRLWGPEHKNDEALIEDLESVVPKDALTYVWGCEPDVSWDQEYIPFFIYVHRSWEHRVLDVVRHRTGALIQSIERLTLRPMYVDLRKKPEAAAGQGDQGF